MLVNFFPIETVMNCTKCGIPASLLNEGVSRGLDVIINMTTEADFHVVALLSKSISRLVPGVHCD